MAFDWLTLNRVSFTSKHARRHLFRADNFGPRRFKSFCHATTSRIPGLFGQGLQDLSQQTTPCDRTQFIEKDRHKIARRLKWSEDQVCQVDQDLHFWKGWSQGRPGQLEEYPTVTVDRVKISTRSTPNRSPTRSSSASTQVHREECYPPYRRVHKVRKESCTETEYPLR